MINPDIDQSAVSISIIPICDGGFPFLLSTDATSQSVTIHDNGMHEDMVNRISKVYTIDSWVYTHKNVSLSSVPE